MADYKFKNHKAMIKKEVEEEHLKYVSKTNEQA